MFIEQQWGAFNPKRDPRIYTRFNIRQQIKGDRDEAADQEVEEEEELVDLEAFTVIRGEVMSLGEEIVAGEVETAEVEIVEVVVEEGMVEAVRPNSTSYYPTREWVFESFYIHPEMLM